MIGYVTSRKLETVEVDSSALRWATLTAQMTRLEALDFAAYVLDCYEIQNDMSEMMADYRLCLADGTFDCAACGFPAVLGEGCRCPDEAR